MTAASDRPVRPYAHRGGADEVLENSSAAVAHAASLPGFYLETDVRLSADGHVVLSHDANTARVWGDSHEIRTTPYEGGLDKLRGPGGAHMVTLPQVLEQYPHLHMNIEPKDDAVVDPLLRVLEQAGAWQRVVIGCFNSRRLKRVRAARPGEVATSLTPFEVARVIGAAQLGKIPRVPAPGVRVVAAQVPPSYFGIKIVTRRFVATCHRAGLVVHVWTVNDANQMRYLLDRGVDGIMTDRPALLQRVLALREG